MENNRRDIIKNGLRLAGLMAVSSSTISAAVKSCGLTPAQTEGPFYPITDQFDKDNDLTYVRNKTKRALGERIIIKGIVNDDHCKPVQGAVVEIWQACASGKYNHPGDPNTAKLDPNFQYWGRSITNARGEYSFITIIPGRYQATDTWIRPPHIHFKVHRRGFQEFTSQLYFAGDKNNTSDRILQSIDRSEQKRVIVELSNRNRSNSPRVGLFNIAVLGA
jgi:protocatechuate 3,4-dioxygenase beta subunit